MQASVPNFLWMEPLRLPLASHRFSVSSEQVEVVVGKVKVPESMDDKMLEVVSISGVWHLGKLQCTDKMSETNQEARAQEVNTKWLGLHMLEDWNQLRSISQMHFQLN
ncbi:hypothetical protein IFM89_008072 [Coptis chinensis]|uniref:Uncharacterized protein n=1 Tax=Coptis chinensis TaxID=261450 RepID=A0A835IVG0_9MAGN|nr:hypothetical protein IFM89_008072 [Coptis chinensis]